MSKFTEFLNLFKWEPEIDAEEEFNIDKALNDNWDKLDTKLKTYMEDMDSNIDGFKQDVEDQVTTFKETTTQEISIFKENVENDIDSFETNVNETVQKLQDSISSTQSFHSYSLKIDSETIAGQEITIPCNYKVGEEVLDVYLNGERLIRSTDESGTDGHYCEIGDTGSISNKIKTTTDWNLETGDILDLVVRGEYSDTIS